MPPRSPPTPSASPLLCPPPQGTSDLTNELHAVHTPDRIPLIYSLSKCVVAARAFKLRVIDGVFLALNDPEVRRTPGLREARGRGNGTDGPEAGWWTSLVLRLTISFFALCVCKCAGLGAGV